jgi:hypothetical protein
MVCGLVQAQSAIMSLNDIYWIIAIVLIPLIPQFLFLPSSKRQRCRSGASRADSICARPLETCSSPQILWGNERGDEGQTIGVVIIDPTD